MFSQNAVEWFRGQLDSSDNASVKHQYLRWHAEAHDMTYTTSDPLFVGTISSGPTSSSSAGSAEEWTLSELLWRARVVSFDERTLWECLSPAMVAERVRAVVDPWNEQLAVKLVYYFVQEHADTNTHWSALRAALDAYAAGAIKPEGTSTVHDYIPLPTSGSRTDAVAAEWSNTVAFVPMEANNDFSEGSLRCTAPVPSCGVLLQVPRSEMFFRDTILVHCALGRAIAATPALGDLALNEEAMLVLCLTYERFVVGATASHWARLLMHCPAHYPTIPTTWDLGDLAELEGLDMLDDVLAKRTQLQAFCDVLASSLTSRLHDALVCGAAAEEAATLPSLDAMAEAFCWEHLAWAQSTFDSRAFNLNVDGTVVMALVPLADMINHTNRTDVLVRKVEPDGGPFTMQVGAALTSADVGRELWMSYGPLQSWELLQHYGFVLGCDNVHDKLPFPLALPDMSAAPTEEGEQEEEEKRDDRYWDARRCALLRRYSLCLPGRCWIGHDGVPPPALLALLRVQLAQAAEFDVMERTAEGPFAALSAETEAAVVATVQNTVQCVLDVFPSTLEEDEEALAELEASGSGDAQETADDEEGGEGEEMSEQGEAERVYNYRLCLQLRIGLKRIAQRTLQWCSDHA